jgi:hypothetical protein
MAFVTGRDFEQAAARQRTPAERALRRLVVVALSLLVTAHSAALIAFNLPYSPLTSPVSAAVDRYVNPWLFQEWGFFAPLPGGWVDRAAVRYRRHLGDGTTVVTGWIDLASLFAPADQVDPLGPRSFDRTIFYAYMTSINNDARSLGLFASLSQKGTVDARSLPPYIHQFARLVMAIEPALCEPGDMSAISFEQQVNFSRTPSMQFATRFGIGRPEARSSSETGNDVTGPWIRSERVDHIGDVSGCIRDQASLST